MTYTHINGTSTIAVSLAPITTRQLTAKNWKSFSIASGIRPRGYIRSGYGTTPTTLIAHKLSIIYICLSRSAYFSARAAMIGQNV
jgi:hypothetical protein